MTSLNGQVAIVTGASRGIGLAIAAELVHRGAKVCITARHPEPLTEAVTELGGRDVAIAVPGRSDDSDHQDEAIDRTLEAFGRVDMLVNNTGINPVYGPIADTDPGAAAKILAVNVLAPLAWTRRARDAWMGEHGGSIVNVASGASSVRGIANRYVYGASKAAVIGLTKSVAADFIRRGIRCNAICPGTIQSPSLDDRIVTQAKTQGKTLDEIRQQFIDRQPMGRLGTPEEIAAMAVFLASDESSYATGQIYLVDGGFAL